MCVFKTKEQKLECSGGEGCCIYRKIDTVPYFDKGGHAERSKVNQPNHKEFWKKEKKRVNLEEVLK